MHIGLSFSGAAALIGRLGAIGVAFGVFLNAMGVPGLSEVLLPLGGVAVRQGHIGLVALGVAALVAQALGLTGSYLIARYGGLAIVERYGKYVLVSHREVMAAHRVFERRGRWLVIVGAFTPGLQGFIGYVSGLAQMSYRSFILSALLGKIVWVSALIYAGIILGGHVALLDRSIAQIGTLILLVLVALVIWYWYRGASIQRGQGTKETH